MNIINLIDLLKWLKLELREHELTPELKDCIQILEELNPDIKLQIDIKILSPLVYMVTYNYIGTYKDKLVNVTYFKQIFGLSTMVPKHPFIKKQDDTIGLNELVNTLKHLDQTT